MSEMNNKAPKFPEQSAQLDGTFTEIVAAEQPKELIQTPPRPEGAPPMTEQEQKTERIVNALAAMNLETHNW